MWFVGVYTDVVDERITQTMLIITILAAILLVIGSLISYFLGSTIERGINMVKERLKLMENGKFDFQFEDSLLKRKDEIGEIAKSSKNMQIKIAEIISGIKDESVHVKETTNYSVLNLDEVHNNIEDISATTEELSAGMEETSASTEEVNASTYEIETEVSHMKEKTGSGEDLAKEIKQRAGKLKEETVISQKNAIDIFDRTNKQLRESIKKTEAIEEIKELSQTI